MDLMRHWFRTLTLRERSSMLSKNESAIVSSGAPLDEAKSEYIEAWSSQPPFDDRFLFEQRLASDGLTEAMFARVATESLDELVSHTPDAPEWVSTFSEAWSEDRFAESFNWPQWVTEHILYGFIQMIEPLISHYRQQLKSGVSALVAQYADLPFDPQTINTILLNPLPAHLFHLASRTLVLEMHVARLRDQLSGDTPEARFHQFLEQLRQPENQSALFEEYVVLAQQLTILLSAWADSSLELLQRLCADWEVIQAEFTPNESSGTLDRLETGLGDRHHDGRSVGILHFASGFSVVYKPRSQSITLHFQEMLVWLNEHGLPQPFRTLKVLDRNNYGWVEFVSARACQTPEEIERFYQRQGEYLALLYALAGTDVHAENLIASGEYPILIDVETLFHHNLSNDNAPDWTRPAASALQSSVLRSLLLPERAFANEEHVGIDLSGLGASPGQLSPTQVPIWEEAGTDQMHIIRKRIPLPEMFNRPTLNGEQVDVSNYLESVVVGFETMYRLLVRHQMEFLHDTGLLARFAKDEIRIILRPTQTYAILLNESYHANHLRDALSRDRLFDYLWQHVPRHPSLQHVIAFERADLESGNIPLFTSRPNSLDLWSSSEVCIPDFFAETSMSVVRRRFYELSDRDMDTQVWFIRAAFLSLPTAPGLSVSDAASPYPLSESTANKFESWRLVDMALAAGARLETLAFHYEHYVAWVGVRGENKRYRIAPSDLNFYAGLPGITLFLAYLGAMTGEQRYTNLAEKAFFTVQSQIQDEMQNLKLIGAFNGWGGIIYLFTHLAVLWDRPDLFAAADRIVAQISELVEQDNLLDVIAGAAGAIPCLLGLYYSSASSHALAVAVQCGDHLISKAITTENGPAWSGAVSASQPLTGFSHGSAGIAWALSALADLTSESRFREMSSSALTYERRAFSSTTQNWRSFQVDDPAQDDRVTWCYGAPGIGLARLNSRQTDPHFKMEIWSALQTTLSRGFGSNHSLCHGDLGNLELLLQASKSPDGELWKARVNSIASSILDDISQHGWKGGTALVTGPELMTGIAGIGYQLLRLAEPDKVPSVLTLAHPVVDKRTTAGSGQP